MITARQRSINKHCNEIDSMASFAKFFKSAVGKNALKSNYLDGMETKNKLDAVFAQDNEMTHIILKNSELMTVLCQSKVCQITGSSAARPFKINDCEKLLTVMMRGDNDQVIMLVILNFFLNFILLNYLNNY